MRYEGNAMNTSLDIRQGEKFENIKCVNMRAFYSLSVSLKEKYLNLPSTRILFNGLRARGRDDIILELKYAFWNGVSRDNKKWEIVKNYFFGNSWFVRELTKNPGSPEALDLIYSGVDDGKIISGPIDTYFFNAISADALANRLVSVVNYSKKHLKELISQNSFSSDNLGLDLGAGYGDYSFGICEDPVIGDAFEFHCIDISRDAVMRGREKALLKGLSNVRFFRGNLNSLKYNAEADYEMMIGIMCPMSDTANVDILKNVKRYLKPGSQLIAACLLDEMLKNDFFCAWLLREMTGWELFFRKRGEPETLFRTAGYENVWSFSEDSFSDGNTNLYEIVVGTA